MNLLIAASEIDVSAGGLVVGLILGVICYLVGVWAARASGHPELRIVGALVGVLVFFVLGFDIYDGGDL